MMVYPTRELARMVDRPVALVSTAQRHLEVPPLPSVRPSGLFDSTVRISATLRGDTTPIPASWQLHGFDIPIYTSIIYPMAPGPSKPPQVRYEFNPVGSYRMHFTISPGWHGRRIILHFDGVDSAFYVWVNGKKLGYSEDSRTPAEFDITKHLKPGSQPAGCRGLPFRRWRLSRRPGYVAHERHLPRRVPVVHAEAAPARFRSAYRSR